jgi:hypothetical protein
VWRNAAEPPFAITTGETVWCDSVSDGALTGTEGTVRYGIGTSGAELTVHSDNPFVGRDTYDERASRGWTALRTGGIGENTRVEYGLDPNKPSDDGCTISLDTARTDVVIGVGANPPDLGPVHTFIPMAYQKVTPPAIA